MDLLAVLQHNSVRRRLLLYILLAGDSLLIVPIDHLLPLETAIDYMVLPLHSMPHSLPLPAPPLLLVPPRLPRCSIGMFILSDEVSRILVVAHTMRPPDCRRPLPLQTLVGLDVDLLGWG